MILNNKIKKFNYIIGDIHGCYEELIELEKIIKDHAEKENALPFIISCGDLIDRGPFSKEVLEHFIKGEKSKTHTAIIGNHELMMIQSLEFLQSRNHEIIFPKNLESYKEMFEKSKIYYPETYEDFTDRMNQIWIEAGGRETLQSFGINSIYQLNNSVSSDIINYLLNLPIFYEDENFFVTHGIPDNQDLEKIKLNDNKITTQEVNKIKKLFNKFINKESKKDIINLKKVVNNIIWNKKVPKEKIHNKLNISGHSSAKSVRDLKIQNALQIDTGCVYGNRLTAYCPETNSFLFIEAKKKYKEKKLI
ncbi:MAG: metallophosphoesterase [Candidatus Sericytochromatia bacterium]